jgi:hypothetical protein
MANRPRRAYTISDEERHRRADRMTAANRERAEARRQGELPAKSKQPKPVDAEAEYRKALAHAKPGSASHLRALEQLQRLEADRVAAETAAITNDETFRGETIDDVAVMLRAAPWLVEGLARDYDLVVIDATPPEPEPDPPPAYPQEPEPPDWPEPVEASERPLTDEERFEAASFVTEAAFKSVFRGGEEEPAPEHRVADERYWREAEAAFQRAGGRPATDSGPSLMERPPWVS